MTKSTTSRAPTKPSVPGKGSKAQRAVEAKAETVTAKTTTSKAKAVPPVKTVNAALSKPLQVSE